MRLSEAVIFNPTERLPKGTVAKKVAMDKLQPFVRDISAWEIEPYGGGAKFRNDDTIMARITPCLENGKIAFVSFLDENEIGYGSTEFIVRRSREGVTDSDYVYYLSQSPEIRDVAVKSMVGSSGRQRVRQTVLDNYEIDLPDLDTQRKIAATLRCFDDKIAVNTKLNHNLEQMAQAIFKSWFVDFEPFGGEQPSEWEIGSLTDIAEYLNGLAMQRFRPTEGEVGLPVLKIKELRQGLCDSSSEFCSPNIRSDYIVHDGDVIFSWSGSLLVDFWCGGDCGLNQHLFKVTSEKYDKWFYYVWTRYHLVQFIAMAADKATTMGHIKRSALENAEVIIPDDDSYHKIGSLLAPLYEQIITNRVNNRKLAQLRDSLLPRLMNGEL